MRRADSFEKILMLVFIMEFTRVGHDFLIPILFAVTGSIAVQSLCTKAFEAKKS